MVWTLWTAKGNGIGPILARNLRLDRRIGLDAISSGLEGERLAKAKNTAAHKGFIRVAGPVTHGPRFFAHPVNEAVGRSGEPLSLSPT
jgi:hypothetical protein